MESIIIPNNVTKIEYDAFEHCTNLKSITFPDTLTEIERTAFYKCTSLRNITLPANVKVASSAFDGCTNLNASEEKNEQQTKFFIKIIGHIEEIKVLSFEQILGSDWRQRDKTAKELAKSLYTQGILDEINDADFYSIDKKILGVENVSVVKVPGNLQFTDYIAQKADYSMQTYTQDAFANGDGRRSKFQKDDFCKGSGLIGVREYVGELWFEVLLAEDAEFSPLLFNFYGFYNDNDLQYNGKHNVRLLFEHMQTMESEEPYLRDEHNSSAVRVR